MTSPSGRRSPKPSSKKDSRCTPPQNGREALDWLQENGDRPCVVLLDLMMPVMDGRTFLGIRGADPSLSKIPVIVVSAESGCFELTKTHDVRVVLHKPIVWEGLVAAIQRLRLTRSPS